mmetsp:Transcript_113629/g.316451  ORF Transcript_113629/g.316451 Transcript_113629/m.316451 type:complete len:141 (-) Transcript_113629:77-499(-)
MAAQPRGNSWRHFVLRPPLVNGCQGSVGRNGANVGSCTDVGTAVVGSAAVSTTAAPAPALLPPPELCNLRHGGGKGPSPVLPLLTGTARRLASSHGNNGIEQGSCKGDGCPSSSLNVATEGYLLGAAFPARTPIGPDEGT